MPTILLSGFGGLFFCVCVVELLFFFLNTSMIKLNSISKSKAIVLSDSKLSDSSTRTSKSILP